MLLEADACQSCTTTSFWAGLWTLSETTKVGSLELTNVWGLPYCYKSSPRKTLLVGIYNIHLKQPPFIKYQVHLCNDVHFLGTSVSLCGRILLNSSTWGRRWLVPISSRLAGACQPGGPCKLCTWLGNLQPTALDKPPKDTVYMLLLSSTFPHGWVALALAPMNFLDVHIVLVTPDRTKSIAWIAKVT